MIPVNNSSKRKRQDPPRISQDAPFNSGVETTYKLAWWKKVLHAINVCPTTLGEEGSKRVLVHERGGEGFKLEPPTPIDCDVFYNFMLSDTKLAADNVTSSLPFHQVYYSMECCINIIYNFKI